MFSTIPRKKSTLKLICHHPAPVKQEHPVFPIFIPFAGCPYRCIYCAQHKQTGQKETTLTHILHTALTDLHHFGEKNVKPFDLAFFGGTFTSLPSQDAQRIRNFIETAREYTPLLRLRCSTRPDAITPAILKELQTLGMQTIELGIQSFSTKTLQVSKRGYTEQVAISACKLIKDFGFTLGIQLMPGMYGQTLKEAQRDVEIVTTLHPDFVRLYPCLVIAETQLENLWKEKEFTPWADQDMIDFLSASCLTLWQNNIKVIRIGVAHEESFERHVLAGTRHQALGTKVRGQALFLWMQEKIRLLHNLHIISTTNTCTAQNTANTTLADKENISSTKVADATLTDKENINSAKVHELYTQLQEHGLFPASFISTTPQNKMSGDTAMLYNEETPNTPFMLYVPQQYSGEFWGHQKELQHKYETADIPLKHNQVVFWQAPYFSFVIPK